MGGRLGVAITLGTPVNRLGISIQLYQYHDFFQVNIGARGYYNLQGYGPRKRGRELQLNGGITLAAGNIDSTWTPLVSAVGNQTKRPYSGSYSYQVYLDDIGTGQKSGTVALQLNKVFLAMENDIFSGTGRDRYRTGAMMAGYYVQNTLVSVNALMWTGNTSSSKRVFHRESVNGARFGYYDLSKVEYGKFSHGILALQVDSELGLGQMGSVRIGIDAEQVRHALQNRLIHDALLWPRKWYVHDNEHYPMLDEEGLPYTDKETQKIRKARFVLQGSANSGFFY